MNYALIGSIVQGSVQSSQSQGGATTPKIHLPRSLARIYLLGLALHLHSTPWPHARSLPTID